ncbi:hypothetical protein AnigIFM62618_009030 [Aspergillus niger]|nr:hypothetical protein AnigIFM62618_009030 [Aspergillus niger]
MASPPPSPLTTTSAASAPPDNSNKPAAPPVHILPTQLATIYSYIHPAALLSAFAARFPALVNDPVAEMAQQLPLLALAHVAYVMICLPAAGSSDSTTSTTTTTPASPSTPTASSASSTGTTTGTNEKGGNVILRPGRVGRRRTKDSSSSSATASAISGRVVASLLSLTLTTLLATPVLSILLVLFGAPFTTHHAQTVLCAAHMAILSSTALVDRPWQAYPITLLTGAYIGFVVGSVLGRSVLFGKRIRFEEEEDVKKVD